MLFWVLLPSSTTTASQVVCVQFTCFRHILIQKKLEMCVESTIQTINNDIYEACTQFTFADFLEM